MGKISFYLYALVLSLLLVTITEAISTSIESNISGVIKNIKDIHIESSKGRRLR
jgi:diacylglycerol kinase